MKFLIFQTKTATFKYFLIISALITYGSVYPFDFQWHRIDPASIKKILFAFEYRLRIGDLAANIGLFIF